MIHENDPVSHLAHVNVGVGGLGWRGRKSHNNFDLDLGPHFLIKGLNIDLFPMTITFKLVRHIVSLNVCPKGVGKVMAR